MNKHFSNLLMALDKYAPNIEMHDRIHRLRIDFFDGRITNDILMTEANNIFNEILLRLKDNEKATALVKDWKKYREKCMSDLIDLSFIDNPLERKFDKFRDATHKEISDIEHRTRMDNEQLYGRIRDVEKQFERLQQVPKTLEKEAYDKLELVRRHFEDLMKVKNGELDLVGQVSEMRKLSDDLRKLEVEAQSMLSKAASVRLADAYLESKNSYGLHCIKPEHKKGKTWWSRSWYWSIYLIHFMCRNLFQKDILFYVMFLGSLFLFGWGYWHFVKGETLQYKYLPIAFPCIWSAWFFQKKINLREKLFETYNHKERLMETYVAFKNSPYNLSTELKMEEILLEAIRKDPIECMGKNNNTLVEEILDRCRGLMISSGVVKEVRKQLLDDYFTQRELNNKEGR